MTSGPPYPSPVRTEVWMYNVAVEELIGLVDRWEFKAEPRPAQYDRFQRVLCLPAIVERVRFGDTVLGLSEHLRRQTSLFLSRCPRHHNNLHVVAQPRQVVIHSEEFELAGGPKQPDRRIQMFSPHWLGSSFGLLTTVKPWHFCEAYYDHVTGNWGKPMPQVYRAIESAVERNRPLVSRYRAPQEVELVVTTSPNREHSVICLASEFAERHPRQLGSQPLLERSIGVAQRMWQAARTIVPDTSRSRTPGRER